MPLGVSDPPTADPNGAEIARLRALLELVATVLSQPTLTDQERAQLCATIMVQLGI